MECGLAATAELLVGIVMLGVSPVPLPHSGLSPHGRSIFARGRF